MAAVPFPLLILAALILAGCAAPPEATIAGLGYRAGAESRDVACGPVGVAGTAQGALSTSGHGVGGLRVTVTDGVGTVLVDNGPAPPANVTGTLVGTAGLWTLRVDAGMGFSGQFAVTLRC